MQNNKGLKEDKGQVPTEKAVNQSFHACEVIMLSPAQYCLCID